MNINDRNSIYEIEKFSQKWKKDSIISRLSDYIQNHRKTVMGIVLSLSLAPLWGKCLQKDVNARHAKMDYIRNIEIESVPLDMKLSQLIVSNDSLIYKGDNVLWKFLDSSWAINENTTSLIRFIKPIYGKGKSFDEFKMDLQKMQDREGGQKIWAFDFEPGFFPNISFTDEDYRRFGVPEDILNLGKKQQEDRINNGKSNKTHNGLPSQEYIWRYYQGLDNDKKKEFLKIMNDYGKSISLMLEDLWITFVFGPVVDTIGIDSSDNKDVAANGRSFGTGRSGVGDLSVAFLQGMKAWSSKVVPVAKHFIAGWLGGGDSHTNDMRLSVDKKNIKHAAPEFVWSQVCNLKTSSDIKENRDNMNEIKDLKNTIEDKETWLQILEKIILLDSWDKNSNNIKIADNKRYKENYKLYEKNGIEWVKKRKKQIDKEIQDMKSKIKDIEKKKVTTQDDLKAVMTSHVSWYFNKDVSVIYDKGSIGQLDDLGCKTDNTLVITDDIWMDGSDGFVSILYEKYNKKYSRDAIRIYAAFAAGNDLVLKQYLHKDFPIDARNSIVQEIVEMIANEVDMNNDGKPDLTKDDIDKKYKKLFAFLLSTGNVKEVSLKNNKKGYIFQEDFMKMIQSSWKIDILQDLIFANTFPFIREGRDEIKDLAGNDFERPGSFTLFRKSIESIIKGLYYNFSSASLHKKQVIIVDKSEQKLFLVNEEGEILKDFDVSVGKWTEEYPWYYDRREFGDGKTPVGVYKYSSYKDSTQLQKEFGDDYTDYGWEEGGMMVLTGSYAPQIAIHGTLDKINGYDSSACVRMNNEDLKVIQENTKEWALVLIVN